MAVYEANIRSLAKFISDTKLGFIPSKVNSTTGYRVDGSKYMISAHKINCERIYIINDCFVDINGNIVVTSYIPNIKYRLVTNELSAYYKKGDHLSFEFMSDSKVLRYKINNNIELKFFDDFERCMNNLIEYIEQNIEDTINEFKGNSWGIYGVVCDILWQVDKTKK